METCSTLTVTQGIIPAGWNPRTSPLIAAVEDDANSGDGQGEGATADRVPCEVLTMYSTAGGP